MRRRTLWSPWPSYCCRWASLVGPGSFPLPSRIADSQRQQVLRWRSCTCSRGLLHWRKHHQPSLLISLPRSEVSLTPLLFSNPDYCWVATSALADLLITSSMIYYIGFQGVAKSTTNSPAAPFFFLSRPPGLLAYFFSTDSSAGSSSGRFSPTHSLFWSRFSSSRFSRSLPLACSS